MSNLGSDSKKPSPAKKASLRQVAATMFWGLFMIGKKGTWERDQATITLVQAIVGGIVTLLVVIAVLITIVRFALP